jgi:D-threo-aldose 1-dehydrogenase
LDTGNEQPLRHTLRATKSRSAETAGAPRAWPRFAVGTAAVPLGGGFDDRARLNEMFRVAIDAGMNWFDTSPLYVEGKAEAATGEALVGIARDSYRLSTKTGYVMNEQTIAAIRTADPRVRNHPPKDFSFDFTKRSLETSFKRLKLSRIDAVFVHDPAASDLADIERGAMRALEPMKQRQEITSIGIGLSSIDAAMAFLGRLPLDVLMIAGQYTPLVRDAADELLGRCAELGVTVIAAGPLNSGLLADPFAAAPRFNYGVAPQSVIDEARRLHALCRSFEVPLRAAALQFPLRHRAIDTVMTGPASIAELRDIIDLTRHPIPAELWAALDGGEKHA